MTGDHRDKRSSYVDHTNKPSSSVTAAKTQLSSVYFVFNYGNAKVKLDSVGSARRLVSVTGAESRINPCLNQELFKLM